MDSGFRGQKMVDVVDAVDGQGRRDACADTAAKMKGAVSECARGCRQKGRKFDGV